MYHKFLPLKVQNSLSTDRSGALTLSLGLPYVTITPNPPRPSEVTQPHPPSPQQEGKAHDFKLNNLGKKNDMQTYREKGASGKKR